MHFRGDCVQAYNDDGTFGGFGEMEYHDPAIVAGRQPPAGWGPASRMCWSDPTRIFALRA
ncbi:MAG: hypothetical protein HC898_06630 [Phycisphaerales bacterium]|nr:hypothetical protein [Phycisphaerales bacterium]